MALLPDNSEIDYNLLVSVLSGTASPEEVALVTAWAKQSTANRELYFRVKDLLDLERAGERQLDVEARWQEVAAQLPRRRANWLKYAAMVAVLLLAGGTAFYFGTRGQEQEVHIAVGGSSTVQLKVLPDGTKVWLKGGSSLRYKPSFGKTDREIHITGTAYLDVEKSALPFVAHTGQIDVTVLGTAFTLHESAVIVTQGKVRTQAGERAITVRPNERARLMPGGVLEKDQVNAQLFGAWRDGDYKFDNTTLAEIKDVLTSNYGYQVEIHRPEAFEGATISGRIAMENEQTVKEVLAAMLQAHIEKTGNKFIIQPK
ncbi:FecR family protein [Chitinophaga alhagiae]|uniref:FecR family protein n=1 Tax=Chitinophaga alhagiae TaxID=2203219 RepID=UPI000E5BF702|nr:FecR domain-containing protein [Chitinophaga alhagiae]